MDLGALFLIILVVLLVAAFVAWPFARTWRMNVRSNQEVSTLLAERDRILTEIQELDFDNSLGKIPPAEYPLQRRTLLQAGADILRQLDDLRRREQSPENPGHEQGQELSGEAEAGVPAGTGFAGSRLLDEEIEEMIAKRRVARKEKTGGFCSRCGRPFLQSDQFCAGCGQPVGQRS